MDNAGCTARDADGCTVVVITGELTLTTAADVLARLRTVCGARRRIILDLTGVTFIDSIGVGVLIEAQRRTSSADGSLRLVCTNPNVLTVLRVSELENFFAIEDSVEKARAAL
jgi:anti-sigma B factor antagonist